MAESELMKFKIRFGLIKLSDFQILGLEPFGSRENYNYSGNLSDFESGFTVLLVSMVLFLLVSYCFFMFNPL